MYDWLHEDLESCIENMQNITKNSSKLCKTRREMKEKVNVDSTQK